MKKFVQALIAGFMAIAFSAPAMAAEQNLYFANKEKCESAKGSGVAMPYTPTLNRPAPSNWKRDTLKSSTCVQMETVQGMHWVMIATGSPMAQHPTSGKWHYATCTNWTNWQPGNMLLEPVAAQMPQVIQAVAGEVVLKGQTCDAKCQQVKICGEQGLKPLDKMNEKGEWLCQAPDVNIVVLQGGSIRGEVKLEQKGWTVSGDGNLPPAPMNFSTQRPSVSVSGQSCNTQGCSSRPVANFVSEVKASYCGIRTTDGRLFKLGSATDGSLVVADWTSGTEGRKMRIGGQAAGNDCDVAQTAVERTHWSGMTQFFGLPNSCTVTQRHSGPIPKS